MALKQTDSDLSTAAAPCQTDGCQYTAALAKGREEALADVVRYLYQHRFDHYIRPQDNCAGNSLFLLQGGAASLDSAINGIKSGAIRALSPSSPGEPAGSRWQPIETAPMAQWGWVWHQLWRRAFPGLRNCETAVWIDTCDANAVGRQDYATHWAPDLPAPPHEPTGEAA